MAHGREIPFLRNFSSTYSKAVMMGQVTCAPTLPNNDHLILGRKERKLTFFWRLGKSVKISISKEKRRKFLEKTIVFNESS